MPVKTFRALCFLTGDNTAFGSPSLVMVISRPPATNSKSADKCALAARTLMIGPTPGMVATSRMTIGPDDSGAIFSVGLRCLYKGNFIFMPLM